MKTGDNSLTGIFAGLSVLSVAGLSLLRKKED
ncbi:LPXTG cell wall anchor domain-containing protein [Thomasclavelia cocleata]|nr:LPXTG cell wall anchor domain-containing protein [Thomasclavelia cocleata]